MEEMEMNNPEDISFVDKDELLENSGNENAMVESEEVNHENEKNNAVYDDDDDDDDDHHHHQDVVDEAEVKELELKLLENPYDYATHVAIISKFKKMGELKRLRISRENMSSKYPLSPELWLSWLRDEIKLATSLEDRFAVEELCERAVKDYLSVEVWLEYLQFSLGSMRSDKSAINKVRELFERGLTAAGLHVTKGAIIWEAFREFESVLLSMATDSDIERKNQVDRIGMLFRRQLACPLLNLERTWEEYEKWRCGEGKSTTIDDNSIAKVYKSSMEKLNVRLPFEDKLVSSQNDSELLDSYKAYILFEKQHGDPGRLTVLYERAITELSLESQLWLDYINYIESNIKIEKIQGSLYERATRNIPWYSEIWIKWLRSLEKWKRPRAEVQNILELALAVEFQTTVDYKNIWMTYLEYLRRTMDECSSERNEQMEVLDKAFNKACEHLAKTFGLEGDPECAILQYWARTEAIHANNMEKARNLWSDIMSQGHSDRAASWLEYISLEKCYGDSKHLRKLYQKALISAKDWPESIANSWINFERDEGTLEQIELCQVKIHQRLEKIDEERNKAQSHFTLGNNSQFGRKAPKKRENTGEEFENSGVSSKKQSKFDQNQRKIHKSIEILKSDEAKIMQNKKKSSVSCSKLPEDELMDTSQEIDENRSIFISNLDYTTTEMQVREALTPFVSITQFKIMKDYKGRSKGYCYVELNNPSAVEEALKLDRIPINGRPMFVSRCDPNRTTRGNAFKYTSTLEKNKLFVKGLSLKTTKKDLEEIFKTYGDVKDVRVVTYRNGHSKGLAYIEFENENCASKALLGTDGTSIDGKVISVSMSKPPERKKNSGDSLVKSLGGTPISRIHFGVPKTLLSMIPRNVKPVAVTGISISQQERKSLNNHDFRTMLLNNKKT